jgi:hypothetical protein
VATHFGRDEAYVDFVVLLVGGCNPTDGRDKLGEPALDQLMSSEARTSHLSRVPLLIIFSILTIPTKLRAPLVQFVDELKGRLPHPLA